MMDYLGLGEKIDYNKYNALVYLLRKFKRLHSQLKLGNQSIIDDFGTYNFIGGLESIEGNWILEDDVNILSQDVLPNTEYTFSFTVVDVNTTGVVNRRVMSFTGVTGETGELNITIPVDSISSDEQILSDFTVDIIFNEHEYYTPITNIHVSLNTDKNIILDGESATVTATITDDNGNPIPDFTVEFKVNNEIFSETTDNEGIATLTMTGTGTKGLLKISVIDKEINIIDAYFYDKGTNESSNSNWWNQNGNWTVRITRDNYKQIIVNTEQDRLYIASTTPSASINPSDLLKIPVPFCIEFDVWTAGTIDFVLMEDEEIGNYPFETYINPNNLHYKMIVDGETIKFWRGNELYEGPLEVSEVSAGFYAYTERLYDFVDFKNFTVYKI